MVGLVLLIATAYYGGGLIYHFGVNVASGDTLVSGKYGRL